jgi:intracellular sulfur oxidation DsrE/DsrF family protein
MKNYVIIFNSNGIGKAEPKLSNTLAINYTKLLIEEKQLPVAILFYAEGVKLCCKGSDLTTNFKILENKGVKLIACTTCLNFYDLKDDLLVGMAGTMSDILLYQVKADKVITL